MSLEEEIIVIKLVVTALGDLTQRQRERVLNYAVKWCADEQNQRVETKGVDE